MSLGWLDVWLGWMSDLAGCLTRLDVSKSSMVIFFEVDGGPLKQNRAGQENWQWSRGQGTILWEVVMRGAAKLENQIAPACFFNMHTMTIEELATLQIYRQSVQLWSTVDIDTDIWRPLNHLLNFTTNARFIKSSWKLSFVIATQLIHLRLTYLVSTIYLIRPIQIMQILWMWMCLISGCEVSALKSWMGKLPFVYNIQHNTQTVRYKYTLCNQLKGGLWLDTLLWGLKRSILTTSCSLRGSRQPGSTAWWQVIIEEFPGLEARRRLNFRSCWDPTYRLTLGVPVKKETLYIAENSGVINQGLKRPDIWIKSESNICVCVL